MGVPRLDESSQRVLTDAMCRARALRHDVVDAEHVLAAIVADAPVPVRAGFGSVVSLPELARRLDANLAARPSTGMYRDGSAAIPISDRLHTALRRAGQSKRWWPLQSVDSNDMLQALLWDPQIATTALEAKLDATDAVALVEQATMLGLSRQHEHVGIEHVLRIASDADWFREALAEVGLPKERFDHAVEERLGLEGNTPGRTRPPQSRELARSFHTAQLGAASARAESLAPRRLVAQLIRDSRELFDALGVSRIRLVRAIIGEPLAIPAELPLDAVEVDVVFHNDDFTTMEFVTDVLTNVFELTAANATASMLTIHRTGEAVIRRMATVDACAAREEALERAEAAAMPLRISLREARD